MLCRLCLDAAPDGRVKIIKLYDGDRCSPRRIPSCGQRVAAGMNENFSLIVMCLFLLASLAFLAQQLTAYH